MLHNVGPDRNFNSGRCDMVVSKALSRCHRVNLDNRIVKSQNPPIGRHGRHLVPSVTLKVCYIHSHLPTGKPRAIDYRNKKIVGWNIYYIFESYVWLQGGVV